VPLRPNYPVRTDRLNLRPLGETDVPALLSYHSLPEVHRYLPMEPMDVDDVMHRLRHGHWSGSTLEKEGEVLCLGVELIATGELIGDTMLRWVSARDQCGEIGYVIHPAHGGHGYATEAARAILQLAFDALGLHRMIARIDARNMASLQLAQRLGMRREAHLISNHWQRDRWADEVDFALLHEEWSGDDLCGRVTSFPSPTDEPTPPTPLEGPHGHIRKG
jgi:RimJ/RimL family protein N-acetyltransferase